MNDRELLVSTVHELRNAVVPSLLIAKQNDPADALSASLDALWRCSEWADKIARHLRETEENP